MSAELDAALSLAGLIVKANAPTDTTAEYRLASALLSLAAESEELRAENDFLKRDYEEVLRAGLGDAKHDTDVNHDEALLILRAHLEAFNERDSALESRRILESRYGALEKAGEELCDAIDGDDYREAGLSHLVADATAKLRRALNSLTPKEGE